MTSIAHLLPPGSRPVAFDTETSGLFVDEGARVSIVTLAWFRDGAKIDEDQIETRCFAFDQGTLDKPGVEHLATLFDDAPNLDEEAWDELTAWLSHQGLIAHNSKFDLHIMAAGHRKWGKGKDLSDAIIWDTQVVNPVVWPNEPTSLKLTAERLWGEAETVPQKNLQKWLKKHNYRFDLAPWELVAPYATKDAEQTLRLWATQQRMIEAGEVPVPYAVIDSAIDLAVCLFRMEQRGVGFDVAGCRAAAGTLQAEHNRLKRWLLDLGMRPVTEEGARRWFYTSCKIEPPHLTDGGKPSVDNQAINQLILMDAPGAREYQLYNSYDDALSRYYVAWPNKVGTDGRLRPSYHQVKAGGMKGAGRGTISGRLSVERIQLHAIPHDYRLPSIVPSIRSFFQARPGHVLYEVDISQAEIRVATWAAKCEPMLRILTGGDDVHSGTAMRVFAKDPGDPDWSKWRTLAKRLTFATLYGAGPKAFREQVKLQANISVSFTQAKEWLDDYRAAFPEFQQLARTCEHQAFGRGFIRLVTGRQRHFSPYERQFHAYKAMNQLIQGNVAEAMNLIKIEVEHIFPGYLINEVHDSLMLEVPEGEEGERIIKGIVNLMENELRRLFGQWDKDHKIPWKVDHKVWA